MTDLVLDASAAGKLFRNEPGAKQTRKAVHRAVIDGFRLLGPPVFRHEILNVIAQTAIEGALPKDKGPETYRRIMDLIHLDEHRPDDDYTTAVRLRITTRDAAYIATAKRHQAVLVSFDRRQLAAAAGEIDVTAPGRVDLLPKS